MTTLFFDTPVQFLDPDAVSTHAAWHPSRPLCAIASYSATHGGSVTLFDAGGRPLPDITYPVHRSSQATALAWHPERRVLASGWENGQVYAWLGGVGGQREFAAVSGPHKAPIVWLAFSERGGRMVTADAAGVLTGWRCAESGGGGGGGGGGAERPVHFLTMFTHELGVAVMSLSFRQTVRSVATAELNSLAKAAVAGDERALDALTNWRPRTAARHTAHAGVTDNHCFYVGTDGGVLFYVNQAGSCAEVMRSDGVPYAQILWQPNRESLVVLMHDMTVARFAVESGGTLAELDRVKLSGRHPSSAVVGAGRITWANRPHSTATTATSKSTVGGGSGGGGTLAIITGDLAVRIWDMDSGENFLLPLSAPSTTTNAAASNASAPKLTTVATAMAARTTLEQDQAGGAKNEIFTTIAYTVDTQTLCAGTNLGNLYTWRRSATAVAAPVNGEEADNDDDDDTSAAAAAGWLLNNISAVRGAIKHCEWGGTDAEATTTGGRSGPAVLVNCVANVFIMHEQQRLAAHRRNVWLVQQSAQRIRLETGGEGAAPVVVHADWPVRHACLTGEQLTLGNDRQVVVHQLTVEQRALGVTYQRCFAAEASQMFGYADQVYVLRPDGVHVLSAGGVVLRTIAAATALDGRPIGGSLDAHWLTVFTARGMVRVYDVRRHELRPVAAPKSGHDVTGGGSFGEVMAARCNAAGTLVALTVATEALRPDGRLYVWSVERDAVARWEFGRSSRVEVEVEAETPATPPQEALSARLPVDFYWDTDDPRLLACETRCVAVPHESQVNVMFVTGEAGDVALRLHHLEELPLVADGERLVNLCVPHVVTLQRGRIVRTALRDFRGMPDDADSAAIRPTILDFSLHLAQGHLDAAFRCIRTVQSPAVWQNLATMCVQTGRLDVARICLGHMQRARSVRALRLAEADATLEPDARVAVLAIELGLIADAERLYRRCGRYDLLNRLLQASGRFEVALRVAEQADRVHLRHTWWAYAGWLRSEGRIAEALEWYSKCGDAVGDITQMLLETGADGGGGGLDALKQHMLQTDDAKLLRWWAQYVESTGDMEAAFQIYQRADDWFAQVRILCFLGQLARADSVARLSGDRSACYHLARHYENRAERPADAVQMYVRAQTFGNAVRICREHDMVDDLWQVGQMARGRDATAAAAYFEEQGDARRAVELYRRGGQPHRAVEMAFASGQPAVLAVIAEELDADADAELVERCAAFFVQSEQPLRAVQLLARAQRYAEAVRVCAEASVPVTEALAELLTPEKGGDGGGVADEERRAVLVQLGELLHRQGDYHTATKKFTQAGDKERAMRALLKSGDTEKIVFFAGMSRQPAVYVMAANYLQSLRWYGDAKVYKNIVSFYGRAGAFEQLANFHVTSAHVEVAEHREYGRALVALQEAQACLGKVRQQQQQSGGGGGGGANVLRAAEGLQATVLEVRRVVEVQQALERGEYGSAATVCRSVLAQAERPPVRHTDVQALLVEALVRGQMFAEGLTALRELAFRDGDWSARGLVDRTLVERLAQECRVDFAAVWESGRRKQAEADAAATVADGEAVEEDIVEVGE